MSGAEQKAFDHQEFNDNLGVANGILDCVMEEFGREIYLKEALLKLPDYNVSTTMGFVYDVNLLNINTHDNKKDDKYIIGGDEEPHACPPDWYNIDKMKVEIRMRPPDPSIEDDASVKSEVSRVSTRSLTKKKQRVVLGSVHSMQTGSARPKSPASSRKGMITPGPSGEGLVLNGNVGTNLQWKPTLINANIVEDIGPEYAESRKYNDGLDENEIDQMRKIIIKRHAERDAMKAKKKWRRFTKQKIVTTETVELDDPLGSFSIATTGSRDVKDSS